MVDIIHRIGIRAPAARVWDAVATTDGIAGWWAQQTTTSPGGNGAVTSRFLRDDGSEIGRMDYALTVQEEARELRWRFTDGPPEWIGTEATFTLSEDGDMTILVFGHRNWQEPVEFMAHCSMKWAVFLLSLRSLLETGEGTPSPRDVKIDNWN